MYVAPDSSVQEFLRDREEKRNEHPFLVEFLANCGHLMSARSGEVIQISRTLRAVWRSTMSPKCRAAARAFSILFAWFLLTTPAFAAPRSESSVWSRAASFWSELLREAAGVFAHDLLPTSGGGGSGTGLDPSGLRRPTG